MTLDESASLTPEQLRVAVAERMGWKDVRIQYGRNPDEGHISGMHPPLVGWRTDGTDYVFQGRSIVPNYPESRDACATFEATLTEDQQDEYAYHLSQVIPQRLNCGPVTNDGPDIMVHREFDLLNANGELRCRAFLAVTENRKE